MEVTPDCWIWRGAFRANRPGREYDRYGVLWNGKRLDYAHRVAYELLVDDIPDGLTIDHLCRNKACVRPDHLEAVTLEENLRRRPPFRHRNRWTGRAERAG